MYRRKYRKSTNVRLEDLKKKLMEIRRFKIKTYVFNDS